MKTHLTLTALALGTALFTSAALADGMAAPSGTNNTMAPAATNNTMAPAGGGMMGTPAHKPKPSNKKTPPANTNAMGGSTMAPAGTNNSMAPAGGGMGGH
jgi:hypothetical protein